MGSIDGGNFDAAPRQTLNISAPIIPVISAPIIPVILEFLQTSGSGRFSVDAVTV